MALEGLASLLTKPLICPCRNHYFPFSAPKSNLLNGSSLRMPEVELSPPEQLMWTANLASGQLPQLPA